MHIKDILEINKSKLINGENNIDYFTINTKDIQGNTMFFPLKGKTDGHKYIINGVENGLAGFFVEPNHEDIIDACLKINKDLVIVEVKDALKALQDLALKTRTKLNIPVIALTGSFGKTSQREMIKCVLEEKFKVLCPTGNYNNHIGMPLTLINYSDEEIILLELGSNHSGEIAFLRDICKPTISLVTNIGTAHIGNFRSLKNTLKEKTSIAKNSEYFLRNMDDKMLSHKKIIGPEVIDYGIMIPEVSNIICGKKNRFTYTEKDKAFKITINSDVDYLINYSICALKIGLLLEMDMKAIIKGIDSFRSAPSRMEKTMLGRNMIIDDCYNASFETMISGLNYFYIQTPRNKIVVLGDILETGRMSRRIHLGVAKYIAKENLDFKEIHLVGKEMKRVYNYLKGKGFNVFYYKNVDEVNPEILDKKSVYLKASHSIGLQKLVENKKSLNDEMHPLE